MNENYNAKKAYGRECENRLKYKGIYIKMVV